MSEQNVMDSPSHTATDDFDGNDFGNSDSGYFEADSSDGSQPAPGAGLSKSSRRRRRKRKGKVGDGFTEAAAEGGSAPTPFIMEGESLALAAAAPAAPRRQPRGAQDGSQSFANGSQGAQSNGAGGGQNPGQSMGQNSSQNGGQNGNQNGSQSNGQGAGPAAGGKRWKKKFRDRERRPGGGRSENPGNDFRAEASPASNGYAGNGGGYRADNFGNQNGNFKRKNKGGGQQRERGFVGPMDHSYRASEAGDAGASTIATNGRRGGHRHHGDSQPIDHSMPRAIPIPENAQTHIYFFIEELFFVAKIQEAAKKLGVKVGFIKNDKDALAALTDGEENRPALIVFDLNNANAKPLTLIPKLKTKLKRSASIVGFLSHLQGDLKAKAVEAGCDVVMPRAAFSQNLPNLLRRYGVEEDEEINFNR